MAANGKRPRQPTGTAHAEYTVQGQRGDGVGLESNIYTLHIGGLTAAPRAASAAIAALAATQGLVAVA